MNNLDKNVTEDLIPLLKQLIQNRCVNEGTVESGHEMRNAQCLKAFFEKAGLQPILENTKTDRCSLRLDVPGYGKSQKTLGLMGHLDVVPADKKNWSFDPFAGESDEAWLYGRGSVDMLGQLAIMATALKNVIKEKGQPFNSIRFFAMADEEADGRLGASRLVTQENSSFHCDYLLTELGGYFINSDSIAISAAEKGVVRLKLLAQGVSAHASMPYRANNAILKLTGAIEALNKNAPKACYTDEAISMVKAMPINDEIKTLLLSPSNIEKGLNQLWKKSPGIAKLVHSAFYLTFSIGVIQGGSKVNVIPNQAEAWVDVRIPFRESKVSVLEQVEKVVAPFGVNVLSRDYFPPNSSSLDNPFINLIKENVHKIYPEASLVPVIPAGVTDGRFWRNIGTEVYGFSLYSANFDYDFFSTYLHGVDEKIDIASLKVGSHFYYELLSDFGWK